VERISPEIVSRWSAKTWYDSRKVSYGCFQLARSSRVRSAKTVYSSKR
jgi:hypothetical protein